MFSGCVYGFPVIVMNYPNVTGATSFGFSGGLDGRLARCLNFPHNNKSFPKSGN